MGVSFAGPAKNREWVEDQNYNFEIWSDDDKTLALYYGAINRPGELFPRRITKVLDAEGKLILEYVDGVSAGTHPEAVLEDMIKLFGP